MGREFELKYAATEAAQEKIAAAFGSFETFSMGTTYYDTPTGALSAQHITLRRRLENGISVCTLKTPTGGIGRGEWEMECDAIETALPELCKLSGWELAPLLTDGVVEVCGAQFTRRAFAVELGTCTLEIALDKGILTGGGKELPLCEVEVELKSGSEEAAVAFATVLAQKYDLTPEHNSKFRRASLLAKGE